MRHHRRELPPPSPFQVPREAEAALAEVVGLLQSGGGGGGGGGANSAWHARDVQLGLATLEEVFLKVAGAAEREAARGEGRTVLLTLVEGGRGSASPRLAYNVPYGAELVALADRPGLGLRVDWEQDEDGRLTVHSHALVRFSAVGPVQSGSLGLENEASEGGPPAAAPLGDDGRPLPVVELPNSVSLPQLTAVPARAPRGRLSDCLSNSLRWRTRIVPLC